MRTEVIAISPDLAGEFLGREDKDHKNRSINLREVSKMARDMQAGRWRLTHQGIAFDKSGLLRDGQHRLMAIIESGCTIPMNVTFDLGEESYEGIDIGRKRNAKDIFVLSDTYKDDVLLKNNSVLAMVRCLFTLGVSQSLVLSNGEIVDFICKHRPAVQVVYDASIRNPRVGPTSAPVHAAALAAILCGEASEDIAGFFDCFKHANIEYSEGKNIQAPLLWANRIMTAKAKNLTMTKQVLYLGSQNAIWNYCNNTAIASFAKAPKHERYPVKSLIKSLLG